MVCRALDSDATHHTITEVLVDNPKILQDVAADALVKALVGAQFTACRRHGKLILLETDNEHCLATHLGLRGKLRYVKKPNAKTHGQVVIRFDNKACVTYTTLFGNMSLESSAEQAIKTHDLGPDALTLSQADLKAKIQKASGNIKSLLMDQHTIAGLGNVYTDEILFQSCIDPRTACKDLTAAQIKTLFTKMGAILALALENKGAWRKFPDAYLTPHRRGDLHCPICGQELKTAQVAGRKSFFCDHCQKQTA